MTKPMDDMEGCEIYRTFDRQNPVVVRVEPPALPDGRSLREALQAELDREVIRSLYYNKEAPVADSVKHPAHYTDRVPGIECIEVTQHFNFNLGNAIKYIWRSGNKGDVVEDLRKAIQYLEFEVERLEKRPKITAGKIYAGQVDPGHLTCDAVAGAREDVDEEDDDEWWVEHDCDITGCWDD